jgi:hypothetical protein
MLPYLILPQHTIYGKCHLELSCFLRPDTALLFLNSVADILRHTLHYLVLLVSFSANSLLFHHNDIEVDEKHLAEDIFRSQ